MAWIKNIAWGLPCGKALGANNGRESRTLSPNKIFQGDTISSSKNLYNSISLTLEPGPM